MRMHDHHQMAGEEASLIMPVVECCSEQAVSGTTRSGALTYSWPNCQSGVKQSEALIPPNPNELQSAERIGTSALGSPTTTSIPSAVTGSVVLSVAGTLPVCTESAVKAASTAPAAPRRCPVAPLVDDTSTGPPSRATLPLPPTAAVSLLAPPPPTMREMARASTASPVGVEVAWALT
eukprot:m.123413 g.123413  ORF g.123413 m.123413 type:complete len:178 (+) comp13461_c0_seq1:2587-3120(+)